MHSGLLCLQRDDARLRGQSSLLCLQRDYADIEEHSGCCAYSAIMRISRSISAVVRQRDMPDIKDIVLSYVSRHTPDIKDIDLLY